MASADSIVRLKVDSKEYDAKIERARAGLLHLEQSLQKAGKSFNDADKDTIQFVRDLGNMGTVANTSRGKVGELSKAFVDLSSQYKRLSDEEKQSPVGKAMAQSLDQLRTRTIEAKRELADLENQIKDVNEASNSGGGFKDMMAVFGGNMLTKAVGWAANIGSQITEVINQSVELSAQAQGIEMAFERLNRPDLLDQLNEATHNTVSNLELMKAAIKFDNFKLPLEELGTYLAFAQQKAKDTGQSIDYMVESIVTGLGRQSIQILDNLGISASEIRDRMKEGGDMTKVVAEIIRDEMKKAGEYVDTASDNAARRTKELDDSMLQLGKDIRDTFGYTGWHDFANGIKVEVVGAIQFTIDTINDAKRAWTKLQNLMSGGRTKGVNVNRGSGGFTPKDGAYWETTDSNGNVIASGVWQGGKQVQTGTGVVVTPTPRGGGGRIGGRGGRGGGRRTTPTVTPPPPPEYAPDSIAAQRAEVQKLTKAYENAAAAEREAAQARMNEAKVILTNMQKPMLSGGNVLAGIGGDLLAPDMTKFKLGENIEVPKVVNTIVDIGEDIDESWQNAASSIAQVGSALASVKDPAVKVAGLVAEAIATIALTFSKSLKGTVTPWDWIAGAASGTATMIATIAAIKQATARTYAQGGIIPGNSYSGDKQWAQVNAGELILSKSQQNNLAAALTNGSMRNLHLSATISGEQIRMVLNNNGRRTGRGEYITTNRA